MLNKIKKPSDVKNMNYNELDMLSSEIRSFLVESISNTGGHLSSNLGVVECTIALAREFDFEKDKIVWDVGHQSYVYKLLSGRKSGFDHLRKFGGMSGFPKREESKYDFFNTGHSSTSISAALGMARARELNGEDYNVIAVIGDGSISGGMAFEALNDAGHFDKKLIVILNDNQMSIDKNVGGMAKYLAKFRVEPSYVRTADRTKSFLAKIPTIGHGLTRFIHNAKEKIKKWIMPSFIYEDLGFEYIGPVNGHDVVEVERALVKAKQYATPVVIHVMTTKGKGYEFAENQPGKFHGIAPFEVETGEVEHPSRQSFTKVFGDEMLRLGHTNDKLIAIVAAMKDGMGLAKFEKEFPNRFFDVGIAEQHATTMAAGFASCGTTPVVGVYSTFMQRAYDQLLHDIGLQNLHVVIALDRAGIVGGDGETHQGVYDYSYAMTVPNLSVLAPSDYYELRSMLDFAVNEADGPVLIRYPRGSGREDLCDGLKNGHIPVNNGKAELLVEGEDITIISTGTMLESALEAAKRLSKTGVGCDVINMRWIKPFDMKTIRKSVLKTGKVIVIEENTTMGGVGAALASQILMLTRDMPRVQFLALPDQPIQHGAKKDLLQKFGLDTDGIVEAANKLLTSY